MTFQEQLITLRKQKGLSQEQLGERLGVTRQTISKWELGITTPEMDKLIELSDLFQISIDELVGRSTGSESSRQAPVREIHYVPWHYEYKSTRTFCGLPLIHINLGSGRLFMTGGIYALGGAAIGQKIAAGDYARAAIAIGNTTVGQICFSPGSNITSDAVRSAILQLFPGTWEIIIRLFTMAISAV